MLTKAINACLATLTLGLVLVVPHPAEAENATTQNGLIAYVQSVPGEDGITHELHVIEDDGTDVATGITSKYSMTLAWSPDGTKLALGMQPDYTYSEPHIFVVNADGTNLEQLTELDGDQPTWSPDGSQIAFVTRRNDPTNQAQNHILYVMDADGSNQHRLATYPAGSEHQDPKWSPDGQWIVLRSLVSGPQSSSGIYRIRSDGTGYGLLVLDTGGHLNVQPTWTNDGQHILFSSDRGQPTMYGYTDVYMMGPAGENITRMADTPTYGEMMPSISPNGAYLAYIFHGTLQNGQTGNIVLIDLESDQAYEIPGVTAERYAIQPLFGGPVKWQVPEPPAEPEPSPTPDPDELSVVSVYRFWSSKFGNAHFFTINEAEAEHLYTYDTNWTYEGDAFGAYAPAGNDCKAHSAVYRFWSSKFKTHFFTSNVVEKDHLIAYDHNWTYEGVAYCADLTQLPGEVPLYRFWSSKFKKHFFTADAAEKDRLVTHDRNWSYEGIAYYVLP